MEEIVIQSVKVIQRVAFTEIFANKMTLKDPLGKEEF